MNHKKNNKKVDFENVNNNSLSNDSINNSSIGMPFKIYDDKSGNDNSHAVLKDINQEDFLKELNRIQNFLNDDSLNLNHDEEKLIKEDLKIITDAVNNNNLSVDGFEDVSVEVEDVSIEEMYEVTDCIFRDGGVTGDSSYESFYNYANFSPSVDDKGTLITNPTNANINYYANIGSATDLFNFIPLFVVEFDVVSVIGDLSHQSIQILEKGSTPFIRTFSDLGITDECHVKITVTGIHIIYQVDDNNPIIESYTTTHARLSIILSKGSLKYKDFEIKGSLPEIIEDPFDDISVEEMYEVTDCIFRDGGVTGDSSYESFYNYANFSPSVDDRGTLITNPTNASINYYANIGSATDLFNFIPLFVVEFDVVSVIGDLSHQSIHILEKGSTPFIKTFSDLGITDECHVKITVTGIHIIYQVDDNNPIIESYTTTHARLSIILSKGSLKYKDFEIRGTLPEIIDEPVVDDVSFGSVDEEFIFEKSSDLDDMNTLVDDDSQEIAIKVDNVTMEYKITKEKIDTIKEFAIRTVKHNKVKSTKFTALKNVSFEIPKGDRVGIIGFNGAGKSTLLKLLSRVYYPTEGTIETKGKIAPLLELGAGFDRNYSGKANIFLNGAFLGFSEEFLKEKYDEIVEFSELGESINYPVKNYSSGMSAKLGFSIATLIEPDILIIDEILSVGDIKFRKKSFNKLRSLIDSGITVLLVSHSVAQIRDICNKAIWLDKGEIKMMGEVNRVCDAYVKAAENATNQQLNNLDLK